MLTSKSAVAIQIPIEGKRRKKQSTVSEANLRADLAKLMKLNKPDSTDSQSGQR